MDSLIWKTCKWELKTDYNCRNWGFDMAGAKNFTRSLPILLGIVFACIGHSQTSENSRTVVYLANRSFVDKTKGRIVISVKISSQKGGSRFQIEHRWNCSFYTSMRAGRLSVTIRADHDSAFSFIDKWTVRKIDPRTQVSGRLWMACTIFFTICCRKYCDKRNLYVFTPYFRLNRGDKTLNRGGSRRFMLFVC